MPKKDPQSCQVAIQGLVKFVQPILDLICDATGWKASLICGGPEPSQGGLLNVVSIHSGTTLGDVKLSFSPSKREQFRKVVVPLYGSFLQKCYTPVECRSQVLQPDQGFLPLVDLDLNYEGASVDPISPPSAHPPPIRLGPPPTATQSAPKPAKKSKTTAKPAPPPAHAAPAPTPSAAAPAPSAAPVPAPAAPAPAPPAPPAATPALSAAPAPATPAPASPTPPTPTPTSPTPTLIQNTTTQPPPSITPSSVIHPPSSQFLASIAQPSPLPHIHPVASSEVQVEQAATGTPV